VPALIQLTKQGLVYVLNRETGEPLVPVEERAVPQEGAVAGEALSPTQPFPVGMPSIAPGGFSEDDAWGFTPFDRGSCRDRVRELQHGPLFTPPSERGTILMPGASGGANWGGGAYDPETNILVVPSVRVPMVVTLIPHTANAEADQSSIESRGSMTFQPQGSDYGARIEPLMSSFGAPCARPPWAALVAINVVTREIVWEAPLGSIERLAPVPIPLRMGTPGAGGPLVTAGGVVFIGFTLDHRFRAFDLRTGRELWKSAALPAPATASPITYEAGGSQYVVIAAGGHSMYGPARSDTVMAYRLRR
jgi:quinoprotein glucose dehydrogenase